MPFSDTTTKNGYIQECEFWTNLGDGGISSDATLLAIFTARLNAGFDRIMPLLYSFLDFLKWDDTNQTDIPSGTFNIVSGQGNYSIAQDDNSLDILNITSVRILPSSTATDYVELMPLMADSVDAYSAMSPNSSETGVPSHFLKRGNVVFLYPKPNYSATAGARIFFEREASYFTTADTTKEAGIPRPFQALLPLYASYDWLVVNKPDSTVLISRIESQIAKREQGLQIAIDGRFPTTATLTTSEISHL